MRISIERIHSRPLGPNDCHIWELRWKTPSQSKEDGHPSRRRYIQYTTKTNIAPLLFLGAACSFEASWEESLPRTGESLATERQAMRSAPRPPASGWDLSVPMISNDKGSGTSPTPPTVEIWKMVDWWNRLLGWYWFSCFSVISVVHSLILVLISMYLFGFEKLDCINELRKKKKKRALPLEKKICKKFFIKSFSYRKNSNNQSMC